MSPKWLLVHATQVRAISHARLDHDAVATASATPPISMQDDFGMPKNFLAWDREQELVGYIARETYHALRAGLADLHAATPPPRHAVAITCGAGSIGRNRRKR